MAEFNEAYPRVEPKALELLSDQGLPDRDIERIVSQVGELSSGYRKPEDKLADVLSGEVVSIHQKAVLLTHGSGALDRGNSSGDCSEGTRQMTGQWASSTMSRHFANIGFHPFYLEVSTPTLFSHRWDDGKRIRSGHSILAVGNLEKYVKKGDDSGFVLIDPTLGVIEPMEGSGYRQTGFVIVPEVEERSHSVPLLVHDGEEGAMWVKSTAIQNLILGIDESASFVYSLWFRLRDGHPTAQIHVTDQGNNGVGLFDLGTESMHPGEDTADQFKKSLPSLERLADVSMLHAPVVQSDYTTESNRIIVNNRAFDLTVSCRYPIHKKVADYVLGLEYAAKMAAQAGGSFSLSMTEEDSTVPSSYLNEQAKAGGQKLGTRY